MLKHNSKMEHRPKNKMQNALEKGKGANKATTNNTAKI